MEKISSMNLTPEQWPYRDARIIVLSNTVKEPPENLKDKVEMYSGDLLELVAILDREGFKHAYVDGGNNHSIIFKSEAHQRDDVNTDSSFTRRRKAFVW